MVNKNEHLNQGVLFERMFDKEAELKELKKIIKDKRKKWTGRESNPRPTACKAVALPTELHAPGYKIVVKLGT